MTNLISVLVVLALLLFFPLLIFWMLVRAVREPGTRWWGIIILLSLLTCYCTTMVGFAGLVLGGNATGSAEMEQRYCERFREALTQTETLSDAIARMDAAAASDEYRVREPDRTYRFRFVWLLAGCFLFAGANLMMFAPGRRERRNPTDCMVMIVAALVIFLTGIWQIAWGNGYSFQAGAYHRVLTGWHDKIDFDAIHATNAEIAAKLAEDGVRGLNGLWSAFLELSGEKAPAQPNRKRGEAENPGDDTEKPVDAENPVDAGKPGGVASSGIAIIGGADGPTAVFLGSELIKQRSGIPAESAKVSADAEKTAVESLSEDKNTPD